MPEVTKNYHRVSVKRRRKNSDLKEVAISEGIKTLYDVKNKIVVAYLLDKKNYTMKEAKKWVQRHKDSDFHRQIIRNKVLIGSMDELYSSKEEVLRKVLEELK